MQENNEWIPFFSGCWYGVHWRKSQRSGGWRCAGKKESTLKQDTMQQKSLSPPAILCIITVFLGFAGLLIVTVTI